MSNSDRALASLAPDRRLRGQVHESNQPLSEQFRLVAREYADADAAASLMEELKTVTLEKLKTEVIKTQGDMPDNRAERIVKASADWEQYIKDMCGHRAKAIKLKLKLEWLRMRHSEWQSAEANSRVERRL